MKATASIHRHLLLWVLGALGIGAAMMISATYVVLADEMGEVFEDNLKQVALAVATHHGDYGTARAPQLAEQLPKIYSEYGKFEFVTAVWTRDGTLLHLSSPDVKLPFLSRSGLSIVSIGDERWHLYTVVLDDSIVQAAQLAKERETLARETASKLILPSLVLLGVIAALLTIALQRGLAPLGRAASDVSARSARTLHPIALQAHPPELHLLVSAINDLMHRLGSALALQRHFLADAAHELRTPIAALKLQLQLLDRAADAERRTAAIAELRHGVERAQHLVEQLLQLSRLEPEAPELRRDPVDLAELARSTVAAFSARAEQLGIDLGATGVQTLVVPGDPHQLQILLNNLVDNALRHTRTGGRIDVDASDGGGVPTLAVIDTGPGIPISERSRVFDRFYRAVGSEPAAHGNGSGLGLAIVKAVADRHHATVLLDDPPSGRGLRASVRFTRAR